MIDEVDQDSQTQKGKQEAGCHRDMRDKLLIRRAVNRSEDEQAIREGGDECAKRDLIAPVSHEVAKQPRAELRGRQLEGNDGNRERHAGDRHHRPGDGRQDRSRPLGPAREGPPQRGDAMIRSGDFIEVDRHPGQRDGRKRHDGRDEPEICSEGFPAVDEPGFHGKIPDLGLSFDAIGHQPMVRPNHWAERPVNDIRIPTKKLEVRSFG